MEGETDIRLPSTVFLDRLGLHCDGQMLHSSSRIISNRRCHAEWYVSSSRQRLCGITASGRNTRNTSTGAFVAMGTPSRMSKEW
ncbi:hypothetical protein PABG_11682 [Paracoccidioides brasiliensis Pb03]|uniref:Uncharacterized protein n=1 Tax=Paracoccidioides brasiliensis TaxID=121759 RepID=A0A1D2JQN9_PARBR|nr:hypothetical protein PABG_11682 [Paracoccidioides brasiliensis Pb03]ODH45441.1 hypothetical protein ACO22_00011 [Paracoccidioides brasiliensis]